MGEKNPKLKIMQETAALQTQVLFSDLLSICNKISAHAGH